jgi:phospholipid transport system transporter-binding protein
MLKMQQQVLWVSGKIDFHNAEDYYQQGLKLIQQQTLPVVVNLSELEQGSTLALAVLVRWLRQTPQAQGLKFQAVPEKMLKIIQACHLQHDLVLI